MLDAISSGNRDNHPMLPPNPGLQHRRNLEMPFGDLLIETSEPESSLHLRTN
jgi:hypothetical protein